MSTPTEHDPDFCVEWQPTLRTIFTKEDIAEIIAAIESNNAGRLSQSTER